MFGLTEQKCELNGVSVSGTSNQSDHTTNQVTGHVCRFDTMSLLACEPAKRYRLIYLSTTRNRHIRTCFRVIFQDENSLICFLAIKISKKIFIYPQRSSHKTYQNICKLYIKIHTNGLRWNYTKSST